MPDQPLSRLSNFDAVYDGPDADDVVVIYMTRRQWWHLDDWRGEHPDRYPNRAAEHDAAWRAIQNAEPAGFKSPRVGKPDQHDLDRGEELAEEHGWD